MSSNTNTHKPITTCIVGGGSSAHVLIPFLAENGHKVNLLTRRPNEWQDVIYCEVTDGRTGQITQTHAGILQCKSKDPKDVIPDADVIILCMPVSNYRTALANLAPYVNRTKKDVYIGTIFGQAGFNWMVRKEVEKAQNLSNVVTFAIGQIPWICRAKEYGKSSANYGPKHVNVVAVTPYDKFDTLNKILLEDISLKPMGKGAFVQACSFLSLTMSCDNQIIHPARCYGLYKQSGDGSWDSIDKVPYFYRDFNQESADILQKLDEEYTLVRDGLKKAFPQLSFKYMLNYVDLEKLNHKSEHVDILASLKDSVQLASIKTPTVTGEDGRQHLNINFRFFLDDIPYGLLIAKALAEMMNIETPMITEVIEWAQSLRGEEFLKDGKVNHEYCMAEEFRCGIPQVYGINSLDEVIDFNKRGTGGCTHLKTD